MKSLLFSVVVLAASLIQQQALAYNQMCRQPDQRLICHSSYQLLNGYGLIAVEGPSGSGKTENVQPEPFDPSECQASLALFTDVGRFIAVYDERSETLHAFLEADGKTTILMDHAQMTSNSELAAEIQTPAHRSISSATFTCHLQ